MNLFTDTISRLGKLLLAAVAVATIVVPTAAARTDIGMGLVDADAWGVSEYAQPSVPVRGENYYARGIPKHISTSQPLASAPSSDAFQWGDAGIGAGFALGLTALTGGGLLVVRRQRGALKTS
jgi:hypothetical protein